MRLVLFFIAGIVLANIVTATFFWHPKAEEKTYITVNSATKQGLAPWMANERTNAPSRELIRKGTLETLDKSWSHFCSVAGHKELIGTIDNYFYQRDSQVRTYSNVYGEAAKRYAIKSWTTTDDNRIQRLMRETYDRGYFSLDELKDWTRAALTETLKSERVTAKPCAG